MNNFYKHELSRREARIKKYIIVTIITVFFASMPDIILGIYPGLICILIISPLLISSYYLIEKKPNVSGTLLLLYITSTIFISNTFYGVESNNSYFYIAEYVMLLLVTNPRNKLYLVLNNLHIGLSILATQVLNHYNYKIYNTSSDSIMIMGNVNIAMAVLASMYLFYTYVEENIEKENYLLLMHKRINTKNIIIENAQVNLETFIYRASHNLQGPIRSIMGLYNLSMFENNSTKLKELIELINESTIKLDNELSITSQVFKINQHTILLTPVNLREFVEDFYQTTSIRTNVLNKDKFDTLADVELLTEGMKNLYGIYLKMRKHNSTMPELEMAINGAIFIFTLTFESKSLDDKYLDIFFAPYQKDLGYLFNLTSEPYMCRRIMDKIHGNIAIEKPTENTVLFTISSKLI